MLLTIDPSPSRKVEMTPEMRFECVPVSKDPAVLGAMDAILRDSSSCSSVCQDPLKMGNWLGKGSTDLVVVDLDAVESSDRLQHLGLSQRGRSPLFWLFLRQSLPCRVWA